MRKKPKKDIKDTLFDYVTDKTKWFYWYHHPDRLEALYKSDHGKENDYKVDDCDFKKKVWRFEREPIEITDPTTTGKPETVVIEKNLADFFDAVLDEVRIKNANAFAKYALYISDNDDLAYFRDTLARREISADIDYDKQRDHAVHTLYNYLLGWYIFEHSTRLQNEFESHFEKILQIDLDNQKNSLLDFYKLSGKFQNICKTYDIEINAEPENMDLIAQVHEFADVWPIASLLHDIGYILEGNLSSASPDVEHLRVTNGSKIIHDYFNHHFWKSFEVDFRVAKNIATSLGVVVPDFRYSRSLASLGDRLCDIGSCENIRNELSKNSDYAKLEGSPYKPIQEDHGLNREAFSMWKEHYIFNQNKDIYQKCNKKMEDILYIVERVYKKMMWVGADHGNRNLDHGVCSGLITLQALTFFHELILGFKQSVWSHDLNTESKSKLILYFKEKQEEQLKNTCDRVSQELYTHIKAEITHVPKRIRVREEPDSDGVGNHDKWDKIRADFWFKKILWATASSAIHSIIQQEEYRKECEKHLDSDSEAIKEEKTTESKKLNEHKDYLRIKVTDDPLAFLGILVDSFQEWDRYTVKKKRGEAAFSDTELLQSFEVGLEDKNDVVRLKYPTDRKNWVKELGEEKLDKCLENWRAIADIDEYNRKKNKHLIKNQKCAESEIRIYRKGESS